MQTLVTNDLPQQLFHSCFYSSVAGVYLPALPLSAVTKLTLAFWSVEAGRVVTQCVLVLILHLACRRLKIFFSFYQLDLGDAVLFLCASVFCTPRSWEERLWNVTHKVLG